MKMTTTKKSLPMRWSMMSQLPRHSRRRHTRRKPVNYPRALMTLACVMASVSVRKVLTLPQHLWRLTMPQPQMHNLK
jgi:hypothetical protein